MNRRSYFRSMSIHFVITFALSLLLSTSTFGFLPPKPSAGFGTALKLSSMKSCAPALMDSGKALARSGELLIDTTKFLNLYGGGLSSAGAQIRNSGDAIAQAAASCRFKTGAELVCDELREGATCLTEASEKVSLAIEEANSDEDRRLSECLESMVVHLESAGRDLEEAGACMITRRPVEDVGKMLQACGKSLGGLSKEIVELAPGQSDSALCSQRMTFAAERMIEAGKELQGLEKPKPKGKGWLKQ